MNLFLSKKDAMEMLTKIRNVYKQKDFAMKFHSKNQNGGNEYFIVEYAYGGYKKVSNNVIKNVLSG